jgi:hypothetical protein
MSAAASVLVEPTADAASGRERRIYTRLSGDDLHGLRLLRLKGGPELQIVDLSRGGALLESRVQMRPGAAVTFVLKTSSNLIEIPSEVLRCQLARFDRGSTLYRGACMFTEPVAIERLLQQSRAVASPIAPAPQPNAVDAAVAACAWQKIVIRYRDGGLLKGYTLDFHPSRGLFSLWPSINAKANERVIVPVTKLKALFFVKDFNGDPQHVEVPRMVEPGAGRRIEVTFLDNEVVKGTTLNYRPDSLGFFVLPLDRSSNNLRAFVMNAAVRHVRFPRV